jgi:glycosyltransferase involved in cell wall biosynthesis
MNINFCGPINNTGYGLASFNILKALSGKNKIYYFPKGQPSVNTQQDYDFVVDLLNNQDDFDIHAPFIKIWHQFDLAERVGKGRYFAYPFFELDSFNQREKKHLSVPDELFVSSNWAKDIILNNGICSIVNVAPLGVDVATFNHEQYSMIDQNKYVFLNIGKWEIRKGHDVLIDIFRKAFPSEEDVELWIVASEHTNNYSSEEQLKEWKNKYLIDSRVKLSPGVDSQQDIAQIISQASCGVFMSRAEGWNLELLECMAMNKPVIATDYSAHTEFCDKDNSYLVNITETERAYDGKAFVGQGNWAKIGQSQIDECVDYMRFVYKNRITNNSGGLKTAQKLSWNNTANIIEGCMSK